jgi:hypothetical protein
MVNWLGMPNNYTTMSQMLQTAFTIMDTVGSLVSSAGSPNTTPVSDGKSVAPTMSMSKSGEQYPAWAYFIYNNRDNWMGKSIMGVLGTLGSISRQINPIIVPIGFMARDINQMVNPFTPLFSAVLGINPDGSILSNQDRFINGALSVPFFVGSGMAKTVIYNVAENVTNISTNISRRALAYDFYRKNNIGFFKTLDEMKGINFNNPVRVKTIPRTKKIFTRADGSSEIRYLYSQEGMGRYFAQPGTPASSLGIYTSGRKQFTFFAKKDVSVLESTTKPIVDAYSMSDTGWKIQTYGGALQYFSPSKSAWSKSAWSMRS